MSSSDSEVAYLRYTSAFNQVDITMASDDTTYYTVHLTDGGRAELSV